MWYYKKSILKLGSVNYLNVFWNKHMFLCISMAKEMEMAILTPNKWGNEIKFFHTFLLLQKSFMEIKPFCGITKKCKNKLCHFLFQLIILGCLGQEEFIIFFSRTFHKYLKKLWETNLLLKMCLLYIIQLVLLKSG